MLKQLPKPVMTYLEAEKAKDAQMLAGCFAADALVHDEERDYRGVEAIVAWKKQADAKYSYVMEPLEATVNGRVVKVRARLSGNFPGSPVELDHRFTLAGDKISSLEIG